jgi:hypothetical protein
MKGTRLGSHRASGITVPVGLYVCRPATFTDPIH